ncbi:MAG: hypothetical protein RIR11_1650 [Bacteroidota bacterium]|jgi:sensor histidine kinase YesM
MSITYQANSTSKAIIDPKRLRLFVWIGLAFLLLAWLLDMASNSESAYPKLLNYSWMAPYIIAANFLFFEHILPSLRKKKILRSVFLLVLQFLVYSFGLYAWRWLGIQLHIYTSFYTPTSFTDGVCKQFQYSVFSFFFFGLIRHIHDHIQLKQTAQQLRIEKQEAELNYLKSQTNPHFLFNTLNNIYALAQDKSDLAPESILRLSDILRFMLYETNDAYIEIGQEVKIISDYIALEKLRYDQTLQVHFKFDVINLQQPIPPLLLIPLVENAFKHGASETRNQPLVDISLSIHQQQLTFIVKNSCDKSSEAWSTKENIGLSNLRRQLELLYTDYRISLQQDGDVFTALLNINLNSHV